MSGITARRPAKSVQHFSELLVWQKAHRLFLELAHTLPETPQNRAVRISTEQLLRSTSAVSALIAEGFNAPTTKEYVYYLDRAKRSGHESENWLYKLYKLRELNVLNGSVPRHLDSCAEIVRMLEGLSRRLSAKRR